MARLILFVMLLALACANTNIHKMILDHYQTHPLSEEISFLAILKTKANVKSAVAGVNFEDAGRAVYNSLSTTAEQAQVLLRKELDEMGVSYQPFWIVNMIEVTGNHTHLIRIASHESVRSIKPNFPYRMDLEQPEPDKEISAPYTIEWNINWVNAPGVWGKGFRGEGFVVANADTGVQWDHPALFQQYRGTEPNENATIVSHDYNWWDAVHKTGSKCGANAKAPCDDSGHGTHTTGTSVGDDGKGNQIGVAPGAQWIACRNMNAGLGTPATYIECLQWFVAPTDLQGNNPMPELRPHVIGNSYGCPISEGCDADTLEEVVANVISAGIFMSVSAGNSGPSCYTINDPPAIYGNVMSVAASGYQTATIASYSSRGPVVVDNSNRPKPDITAPGSSVRSCYPTNSYATLSGTSMASPHITGAIALLWQARPELTRDIATTTQVLLETAIYRSATTCANINNKQFITSDEQNNVYGHGEINLAGAIIG